MEHQFINTESFLLKFSDLYGKRNDVLFNVLSECRNVFPVIVVTLHALISELRKAGITELFGCSSSYLYEIIVDLIVILFA